MRHTLRFLLSIFVVLSMKALLPAQNTQMRTVTSLPATCVGGTAARATDVVSLASGGVSTPYICSSTNVWTALFTPGTNLIQASVYGVRADAKFVTDATISTGNTTIDCSFNSDCNFTSADIGKRCFVRDNATAGAAQLGDAAGTNITAVADAQHATCGAVNATANLTHTGNAVWGSDDTTALQTAWNNSGKICKGLQLPAGNMLTTKAQFITQTVPCPAGGLAGATSGTGGAEVAGYGQSVTLIVPTPDFDYTTCARATGNHIAFADCFFGVTLQTIHGLQLSGFNVSHNPAAATLLVANEYLMYDVVFGSWCGGCANANGFAQTNQSANAMMGGAQNLGDLSCVNYGAQTFLGPNWACIGTQGHYGLFVSAGSAKTINTFFSGTQFSVNVAAGAQWLSDFDEWGGGSLAPIQNNGTMYLNRFNGLNTATASWFPIATTATGKTYIQNSPLNPASGNWATVTTGGRVFDQGGNTFTGGVGGTAGAAGLSDFYSANTANCVSGNFAFTSGWGTTAITGTPSGNSLRCTFAIQTTVSGSAGPVLTYTFPTAFTGYGKTPGCVLTQVGGTFTLSNPAHVVTATTDTITFTGTPTATQTYNFVEDCK